MAIAIPIRRGNVGIEPAGKPLHRVNRLLRDRESLAPAAKRQNELRRIAARGRANRRDAIGHQRRTQRQRLVGEIAHAGAAYELERGRRRSPQLPLHLVDRARGPGRIGALPRQRDRPGLQQFNPQVEGRAGGRHGRRRGRAWNLGQSIDLGIVGGFGLVLDGANQASAIDLQDRDGVVKGDRGRLGRVLGGFRAFRPRVNPEPRPSRCGRRRTDDGAYCKSSPERTRLFAPSLGPLPT